MILASAEPFADSLVEGGRALGIDQFLLVQWLAPLASEAPEFIVALLFAWRGKGAAALGLLISAKVNQWTLLIGSLPIAYGVGGGPVALHLDGRQVEEFLLTATQTLLGLAVLLSLRFPRWAAWTLLGLFAVQFAVPGQTGRYVLSAIYLVLAVVAVVRNRQYVCRRSTSPFRRTEKPADAERADELVNGLTAETPRPDRGWPFPSRVSAGLLLLDDGGRRRSCGPGRPRRRPYEELLAGRGAGELGPAGPLAALLDHRARRQADGLGLALLPLAGGLVVRRRLADAGGLRSSSGRRGRRSPSRSASWALLLLIDRADRTGGFVR